MFRGPGQKEVSTLPDPTSLWDEKELSSLTAKYEDLQPFGGGAPSKYNPTPGTGRTGYMAVPPNNYPFYNDDEKYVPIIQADGGQLSEWKPMYNPSAEQAEKDRKEAFEKGVPHGYVAPGDKYKDLPTISLHIASDLHDETEYGENVDSNGRHIGGPFIVIVSPKMRVEDLKKVIRDKGGIPPGLQRLSYAGKHMEDSQRTLEQYGVSYWHARFPHWPIKIRRY